MYNKIVSDIKLINDLKVINDSENLINSYACHGYNHALRVSKYCGIILTELGATKHEIELAKISGYLHDMACAQGKKNHSINGANMAREYLQGINMKKEDVNIIYDAIYYHSKGERINSNISAALLLADKIDISKARIIKDSYEDVFAYTIASIEKVNVNILKEQLEINYYTTNADFDIESFKSWEKAISVPIKVADYFNKKCIFNINGQRKDLAALL